MTKKEKNNLISWLVNHPGYLKKGSKWINVNIPSTVVMDFISDLQVHEAKKEARLQLNITKENLIISGKELLRKSKNVKVLYDFKNKLQYNFNELDNDINIDKLVLPSRKVNLVNTSDWGFVSKDNTKKYEEEGLWIIIGCVHIPSHNAIFYQSFLHFLIEYSNKIKGFIIAGDFLDMEALGSFAKGSLGHHNLHEEYQEGNNVLNTIDEILPKSVQKIYVWGNHEDRYNRYMKQVDNSKLGAALQSPTTALKLVERGYHVFEDWKKSYVTIGKYLDVLHGEFFNIHTAKKHLDTYRRSCLYFHTHRKQIYIEGNEGAFNCGSMANFNSSSFSFASRSMIDSWSNAFAVVNIDKEGFYHVDIPTWMNNKFIFGNKVYSHGK